MEEWKRRNRLSSRRDARTGWQRAEEAWRSAERLYNMDSLYRPGSTGMPHHSIWG